MDNKEKLINFFDAENKRDWITYRKFLSKDIIWELHSTQVEIINGINDYMTTMIEAYQDSDDSFICESMYLNKEESRIVTLLLNNCGKRSCDIFEFSHGLIIKEYEYILG